MRRILASVALVTLVGSTANAATSDVQNVYQQFDVAICSDQGDCTIVFPQITTAQTLILHASCSFSLAPGGSITSATLGTQNTKANNQLSAAAIGTSLNGLTTYGINAQTYLFVSTGDRPKIDVDGSGSAVQDLACTVSGHY
jgi:hypothetical protein